MGVVVQLREERGYTVRETCVQVSRYPQDDGSGLFCVEVLFPDGTWNILHRSKDLSEAWRLAGVEAGDRRVALLADSLWPERSTHS